LASLSRLGSTTTQKEHTCQVQLRLLALLVNVRPNWKGFQGKPLLTYLASSSVTKKRSCITHCHQDRHPDADCQDGLKEHRKILLVTKISRLQLGLTIYLYEPLMALLR